MATVTPKPPPRPTTGKERVQQRRQVVRVEDVDPVALDERLEPGHSGPHGLELRDRVRPVSVTVDRHAERVHGTSACREGLPELPSSEAARKHAEPVWIQVGDEIRHHMLRPTGPEHGEEDEDVRPGGHGSVHHVGDDAASRAPSTRTAAAMPAR